MKKHYTAYRSWTFDELPMFAERKALEDAWRLRGVIHAELRNEARSFVHSVPTHKVMIASGAGVAFKVAATKAGYRVHGR